MTLGGLLHAFADRSGVPVPSLDAERAALSLLRRSLAARDRARRRAGPPVGTAETVEVAAHA